ncbi:hypothetical protein [Citromicrobium bathyomarinum]|uniref:hypothetical protein n=1 Tax=Citromicrobium bathyomarinum TaxID=72174 RepID=UPI00315AB308
MLGYRFEVVSRHPPEEVKRRLKSEMLPWFEAKNGARGWIVGSYLCLWRSALDRYGPMIFARIRGDAFGSKVSGRAGSDLNGTLWFVILTPIMAWIVFMAHREGQYSIQMFVTVGIVFGLGLPLTLWFNHKIRKDADPLVRFVERSVGAVTPQMRDAGRIKILSAVPVPDARIEVDGVRDHRAPSEEAIFAGLDGLEADGILILEFGKHHYMQTLREGDLFILERRDGSSNEHYRSRDKLTFAEVTDAFCLYLRREPAIDEISWERVL